MSKYYVAGAGNWIATNAKTLSAAKAAAARMFQVEAGGRIYVGEQMSVYLDDDEPLETIERVAVKHGYGNWQDA